MLKTKKELMLELGKLNLELTDLKRRLSVIIEMFPVMPYENTQESIKHIYRKMSGVPILNEIKVNGHGIIKEKSCYWNDVNESDFKIKNKAAKLMYAKAFYCLLCLELGLRDEKELASDIGRDRTTIHHYKKLYKTKVKFRKRYEAFVASLT